MRKLHKFSRTPHTLCKDTKQLKQNHKVDMVASRNSTGIAHYLARLFSRVYTFSIEAPTDLHISFLSTISIQSSAQKLMPNKYSNEAQTVEKTKESNGKM